MGMSVMLRRACTALTVLVVIVGAAPAPALSGRLQVVELSLHLQPSAASGEDGVARACRSWKLTETDVRQFFANAVPISQADLHDLYSVLPCEYSGTFRLDGVQYGFVINGGAHAEVQRMFAPGDRDRAMYGCRIRCAKMFPFGENDKKKP
jgi:hypothetical protein